MPRFISTGCALTLTASFGVVIVLCVIAIVIAPDLVRRANDELLADMNITEQIATLNSTTDVFDRIKDRQGLEENKVELSLLIDQAKKLQKEFDAMDARAKDVAMKARKVEYDSAKRNLDAAMRRALPRNLTRKPTHH